MVTHLTEEGHHPAPNDYGLESMSRLVRAAEELKGSALSFLEKAYSRQQKYGI